MRGGHIEGPPISYKTTVGILPIPSNCVDSRIFGRRIEHKHMNQQSQYFMGQISWFLHKQVFKGINNIGVDWSDMEGYHSA